MVGLSKSLFTPLPLQLGL